MIGGLDCPSCEPPQPTSTKLDIEKPDAITQQDYSALSKAEKRHQANRKLNSYEIQLYDQILQKQKKMTQNYIQNFITEEEFEINFSLL